jgi:hypothetical protein
MQNLDLFAAALIALLIVNVALAATQLLIISKFERLLTDASNGAADHFEKLRKVRQVGV